jgi:hypothetical protein
MIDKYSVESAETLANEAQVLTQFLSFNLLLFFFCNSFTFLFLLFYFAVVYPLCIVVLSIINVFDR